MVLCVVVGCSSKSGKHKGLGFFRIPKIITNQGEEQEELTTRRRNEWISAVSRGDTTNKRVLESERVCSKHFVFGEPAPDWDQFHVDWVPTVALGKKKYVEKDHENAAERALRAKKRRQQAIERAELEAAEKKKRVHESGVPIAKIDFSEPTSSASEVEQLSERLETESVALELDHFDELDENTTPENPILPGSNADSVEARQHTATPVCKEAATSDSSCQTDAFEYMFSRKGYQAPTRDFFDSDSKVLFYTGLPSLEILMVVFEHVSPHVTRKTLSLDRFQEFVIVLMKLRLNMPLQDLAYRFQVSHSTVSRIFSSWLVVMDTRLFPLISWPEREQLWRTMPQCFMYSFGKKVTVVIDCFEVFIEKPTNLLARAQTFSSYKHHNTIKLLIGITPQGTVSYVSEAWGGRTSDKFLTENCGFLEKLLPGDMVMADRGFTISESVGLKQAKLEIPTFTKGKSQLDPVDVENTRGIANVRIHVERVIGLLRRKYTILEGTLRTEYLACNPDGPVERQIPLIDRIVRICAALVNFCPPIIPFD